MPGNPTLKKQSICDRVCGEIRKAILGGIYRPGDRLPSEGELCEIFLVGRGSIREALKRLEMVGLVNIIHGRGVIVADCDAVERRLRFLDTSLVLTGGRVGEVLEVCRAMERLALDQWLARGTGMDERLEGLLESMDSDDSGMDACAMANHFLAGLVAGAGNGVLCQVHECLRDLLGGGRDRMVAMDASRAMVRDYCRCVVDGIARGDGAMAEDGLALLHGAMSDALTSSEAEAG